MRYVDWYWNGWLGRIIGLLDEQFKIKIAEGTATLVFKIGFTVLAIFILLEIYFRIRDAIQQRLDLRKKFVDVTEFEGADTPFADTLEASRFPERTIKPLIKQKQYARVAAIYASINKPQEAAKFYKKAGDLKGAAENLARTGQTEKAAKLLMKHGDYVTAARFFDEINAHTQAAKAYGLAGDPAKAALAIAKAGKGEDAMKIFADYFDTTEEPADRQLEMADACYAAFRSAFSDSLDSPEYAPLLAQVGERFLRAGRTDLAASVFVESGDTARAAEVWAAAGNYDAAINVLRQHGLTREAALYTGRKHQAARSWAEAAAAFVAAGDLSRAAYAHLQLKQPEQAVPLLEKIPPEDPEYARSRAILAKALYDLRDFGQCIATVKSLLSGRIPDPSNLDLFYLLGLAQEQEGKIDSALTTFNAIRAINPQYGDLARRIPALAARKT